MEQTKMDTVAEALNTGAQGAQASGSTAGLLLGTALAAAAWALARLFRRRTA